MIMKAQLIAIFFQSVKVVKKYVTNVGRTATNYRTIYGCVTNEKYGRVKSHRYFVDENVYEVIRKQLHTFSI